MAHADPFNEDDSASQQIDTQLQRLPLNDLALFCAHELQEWTEGRTPNDRYPLELFRRAVILHDNAAWGWINRQYAPFVLPWLLRHPQAESLLEQKEPAALVNAVLSRLAANLTEEKLARLHGIPAIMQYLRLCVHSTLADPQRDRQLLEHLERFAQETGTLLPALPHAGRQEEVKQGLWQVLREELPSEDEQLLFTLLFVRGLPARAVCIHEAARFPDTEAVYRMKGRILERLRNSERIQAVLGHMGGPTFFAD